jgi:uncharacterized membrane protein YphA (DoxX/SURF4 family)
VHSRTAPGSRAVPPGSLTILRISVGVIYCWFGSLKLFPAVSPAEHIAIRTMTKLTGGLVPAQVSLPLLGTAEALIGLALITGILLRHALVAFYAHMGGVFSSLVLLPDAMWHHGVPTLDGQYVLKNLVLVASCLAVTAEELDPLTDTRTMNGTRATAPRRPPKGRPVPPGGPPLAVSGPPAGGVRPSAS